MTNRVLFRTVILRTWLKDITLLGLLPAVLLLTAIGSRAGEAKTLTDADSTGIYPELSDAEVGKLLFFDKNLSYNRTMSCATCHDPAQAFNDQRLSHAHGSVSQGANGTAFGVRNTLTASYANTSPTFHFDSDIQEFVGGQFWDGRSATLAQQAMGPPLDANEMAMPSAVEIVKRLQANPVYEQAFKDVYGDNIFYVQDSYSKYRKLSDPKELPNAFIAMGNFIQAFEQSDYFSPFDSKYDRYLEGKYVLSTQEEAGRKLFFEDPEVSCRSCHMQKQMGDKKEAFTSHRFRNVGVPSNPALVALHPDAPDFIDVGLMNNTHTTESQFKGKFKVPALRNVALTAPYMHNGVFHELRTVIAFFDHYNNPDRKINPETGQPWGVPEVAKTLDHKDLAGRPLSDTEIDNLVAFFKTLTDQRYENQLENNQRP